ncbi:MAG: hypothetical protein ACYTFG_02705 [Planctomycetota bacterium]
MTKTVEDFLKEARVPDPGELYWNDFPGRVATRLEAERSSTFARPHPRWGPAIPVSVAATAAAIIMLITLLGPQSPSTPAESGSNHVVMESEKTVKLALDPAPEGILQTLNSMARDKASRAQAAAEKGDWPVVAPLIRSYEKILTDGLLRGVERALEEEEDLSDTVPGLVESVSVHREEWIRMVASARDEDAQEALESAIDASDSLLAILEDRF